MPTTVVNKNRDTYDVSITRGSGYGNPYIIGKDGTREDVLYLYERYITNVLKSDPTFLDELKNKRLGCVCKPLACHGDIIVKKLEEK